MSSFVTIKKPYKYKSLSVKGNAMKMYCFKLRDDEYDLLIRACNKLDTKFTTFMKYCAIEAAKEILKDDNDDEI